MAHGASSVSRYGRVLADVKRKITPSEEEKQKVVSLGSTLVHRVKEAAEKAKVKARVRVEGSVAKDTWLRGEPDIDIFLQLPPSTPRAALGSTCLMIAREATRGSKQVERFAEHPYLEAFVDGTRVNIVPCYKTKPGEWRSATDRTPYHTDFVGPRLTEESRSEIRLLKRFMKGIGVYGAEIKVGGFSGYLCELLTVQYGMFLDVLKASAAWKKPWKIDYLGYYKGKEEDIPEIFSEPLVVVDPVDKGRNVASAVRRERLTEFVAASRRFLQYPSTQFFFPEPTEPLSRGQLLSSMKKRGTALVFVKIGKVRAVPDVLWGQLYRTRRALRNLLAQNDFNVVSDAAWSNENDLSVLLFEVEDCYLPATKKHLGPPIEKKNECDRFLQKHLAAPTTVSGPSLEDERWIVSVKRKHTDVVELLSVELEQGGRQVGVAELISKAAKGNLDVLVNEQIVTTYNAHRDFAKFLTEHIRGRPKWLAAH